MNDNLPSEMNAPAAQDQTLPPRPPFFRRLWMVPVTPTELFTLLAQNPAWFPMTLFAMAVGTLGVMAIPSELIREISMQGQSPEAVEAMSAMSSTLLRTMTLVGTFVGIPFMVVFSSVVVWVIFSFMRGDEARFKQHLAVVAHTTVITVVIPTLVNAAIALAGGTPPTFTLGSLLPMLSEGYLANVLNGLQLFNIWGALVAGIGIAAIDPRRSATPTAVITLGLVIAIAMVLGVFR